MEKLYLELENIQSILEFDAKYCPNYELVHHIDNKPLNPDHSRAHSIRNSLYQLMLCQHSSTAAYVYYVITIIMIFISLLSLVLEEQFPLDGAWDTMEYIITIFFTLEYLVTLAIVNNPCDYAKQASSLADLLAVFPLYIEIIAQSNASWILLIRLLRIARISRIRQTPNPYVNLIGSVFYQVQNLLLGIIGYLTIGSLIIGTFSHVFEEDTFDTIPRGMWYGLVTLTTVGYGDFYPQETVGYFIGSLGIIIGLVLCSIVLMAVGQIYTDAIAILKDQFGEIEQCLIDSEPQYIMVKNGDDMHMSHPSWPVSDDEDDDEDDLEKIKRIEAAQKYDRPYTEQEAFQDWLMACVYDSDCYPKIPYLLRKAKKLNGQITDVRKEISASQTDEKDEQAEKPDVTVEEPIKRQPETELAETGGASVQE